MSAVLESNTGLLAIEGDILLAAVGLFVLMIYKTVNDFIIEDGLFYYLLTVLDLNFYVKKAHRLDTHKRPHLAEAMASAVL